VFYKEGCISNDATLFFIFLYQVLYLYSCIHYKFTTISIVKWSHFINLVLLYFFLSKVFMHCIQSAHYHVIFWALPFRPCQLFLSLFAPFAQSQSLLPEPVEEIKFRRKQRIFPAVTNAIHLRCINSPVLYYSFFKESHFPLNIFS